MRRTGTPCPKCHSAAEEDYNGRISCYNCGYDKLEIKTKLENSKRTERDRQEKGVVSS